jgi:hypothetical protein
MSLGKSTINYLNKEELLMEFLTNKITEDQIRRLVSESKNPVNPLKMVFPYDYVTSLVPLNWYDMSFAIKNNLLKHQAAINHAIIELQKNDQSTEELLELACMFQSEAKYPHDIFLLVEKLATVYNSNNTTDTRIKFLYVSLNWVYEHKDDYCNLAEVVDILCDVIDYPNEVKNLLSYMPSSNIDVTSTDMAKEQLFKKLELYLENQCKRWTSVMS